jgi:RNA polymerase sigma factor for flagellar operon FliA
MAAAKPHDEDPHALWREYRRTGDRVLRDRVALAYAPLARSVAHRKARDLPPHTDAEDLVSVAHEALLHAIEHYDPRRGTTLAQYVWTRLHGAILDELRRLDWAPRSVRRWQRDIAGATAAFAAEHGRAPRPGEIAEALGVTAAELRRREREIARARVSSMDAAPAPGHRSSVAVARAPFHRSSVIHASEIIDDDPTTDPLEVVASQASRERLRHAIEALDPRERHVAALLYVHRLTMAEAGRVLGVSDSRVSQLHRGLTTALREALEDDRALFVTAAP